MDILHIIANPKPAGEANSKQITEAFFQEVKKRAPQVEINTVDLNESPPPYYSYSAYRYFWYPVFIPDYKRSEEEKAAVGYALEQIELFNRADVLVITSPMWNFGPPAILKAWQDQVLAPNGVFTTGPGGTKPLHHIKKAILMLSSGGAYSGDRASSDHLTGQLKTALGFIGIKDVEIAWADGQNPFYFKDMEERKQKAAEEARRLGEKVAQMTAEVKR